MKNWKTTVGGILGAAGAALTGLAILPPPFTFIGPLLTALGLLFVGLTAKDANPDPK